MELVERMLGLAEQAEKDLADRLIENALEDCVSAFDGFGREFCRVHGRRAANPDRIEKATFQNLEAAKVVVMDAFGIDLSAAVTCDEWKAVVQGFQKRHLVAHKMGVIDQEYVARAGDPRAVVGRRIVISEADVRATAQVIKKIAVGFSERMRHEGEMRENA